MCEDRKPFKGFCRMFKFCFMMYYIAIYLYFTGMTRCYVFLKYDGTNEFALQIKWMDKQKINKKNKMKKTVYLLRNKQYS